MRKPDFFIVGAPRCGTSAMRTYLDEHPEIFMATGEPHFIGTDLAYSLFIRVEQSYLSLFDGITIERRVGEKSRWYLYSRRAAAEIKAFQPSAKIIIMLRNPVDMLYSLHTLQFKDGLEDIADFEASLEAEKDRRQGRRLSSGVSADENWRFLHREIVKHAEQVQRYQDVFERESVHIIVFDDFRSETERVYGETLRFLDVGADFQPELDRVNPTVRVRSRALNNFLSSPPPALRSFVLAVTPLPVRHRITKGIRRLNMGPIPPLNQKLKRQLQAEFLLEVEKLSALLDRDLTHWCQT